MSTRKERIGWYFYDWANSAFTTTVVTVFLGPYLTSIAKTAADINGNINILGLQIYADSFFAYCVSLSVLLQVILLPVIGGFVDFTGKKKLSLALFAYLGSIATAGLYFVSGNMYLLGGILFIIANICFGASIVVYNSFLNDISEPDKRDSVSSTGWAIGYLGGGLLLALNLMLFSNAENFGITSEMAVRISLCSAGMWWGLFTIVPMINLKSTKQNITKSNGNLISSGFKQLISTIKDSRNHPKALLFLIAYLFYNDGVQAAITLSAQFGKHELGLSMSTLTQAILMVQFVAFVGSIFFNFLSKKFGNKNSIILSLIIWSGALYYAYGFLYNELGFYILAAVIAIVLGGTQALSRSLYSVLIPKGKEAEYFGLYEAGERGTSWLGPLMFGIALQTTHSYRIAILSLIIFFIIGIILLLKLKLNK